MKRSNIFAGVFLGLFALPFCGFGLAAVFAGLQKVAEGDAKAWVLTAIGAFFALIGFALVAAALKGPRKVEKEQQCEAEHAADPWVLRTDWAQGRVDSKTRTTMVSAWVFAVLWNLISSLPIFFFTSKEQYFRDPKLLIALLFPAAGLGLLVWAVRETMRWFEFGKTSLQLASVPCVIGRDLQATISARFTHIPDQGVRLKLSCVNIIVSRSGKDETRQEKILWQEDATVPVAQLYSSPTGTTIPVSFHIPLDMPQTDNSDRRNSISWVLEADASVPGVDYKDIFELPVFRTKDTPNRDEPQAQRAFSAPIQPPTAATILVRQREDGTEFYFPAARNKSFAFGVTLFASIFSTVSWAMLHYHVVFIFPLIFGSFSALLIYMTLQMWFGTSTVLIGASSLRVKSGLFGVGTWSEIPFSEMSDIQMAITAQQGGSSGTPYYDIQLVQTSGRKITLGSTVRNKHEAEWLVAEMKQMTGLSPQKAAAAASGR